MVRRGDLPRVRRSSFYYIYFYFPLGSRRPCCAAHAPSNARRAGVAIMQAPRGGRTVAVTLPGCHHPVRRTAPSRVSCWPAARRFAGGCRLRQIFWLLNPKGIKIKWATTGHYVYIANLLLFGNSLIIVCLLLESIMKYTIAFRLLPHNICVLNFNGDRVYTV